MNWFAENAGTIVVAVILLAIVVLVTRKIARDKKQGKSTCGCGCASCPMSGSCHKKPR